ncbi:type II secretion system protein GspM [Limnohabitans sp. DCL3]|uniref:type II secretion system protein GspM n=1 Tax=Limnohabitans sp. DCL3 TaxID=3374103 RepID=UPI003A877470
MKANRSHKPLRAALQHAWAQRPPREQRLLRWAAGLLVLGALWSLAMEPAWRTWQQAPARQAMLDAQSQTMLELQAQAQSLQKPNPISRNESIQWLENNLSDLGPGAQIIMQGERATLNLSAAPPEALARWLGLARERALAMPIQAQLQPSVAAGAVDNAAKSSPVLRGTMLLRLP